jgi:hypothetical protein
MLAAGCSVGSSMPSARSPTSSTAATPAAQAQPPSATSPSAAPPVPVLGQSRGITEGYGSAQPTIISNGGDPTGIVTDVSWQSWGGPEAVGTGTGYYDPPNVPVHQATMEKAIVVAFDLGTCAGQYMYQGVEWYFPESGGSFNNTTDLNICSWTYYPGPAPTG